tara:strand:+ start:2091 stop:2873 length:783 start_codon:yes stop_codon:yes gene_type:complete
MDIVKIVADYFIHSDYNFLVTSNVGFPPPEKNTIVFLTGNERNTYPINLPKTKLLFAGFFGQEKRGKMHYLPIGVPKHFNNISNLNLKPIKDRDLNMFYCGCKHANRGNFFQAFNKVAEEVPNCLLKTTPRNNPQKEMIDENPEDYMNFDSYWSNLCNTKIHPICINKTTSHDNYRYFESVYAGTINVMAEKNVRKNIWIYDYPMNVFIDSWKDLTPSFVNDIIARYDDFDINWAIDEYKKKLSKHSLASYVIETIEENE